MMSSFYHEGAAFGITESCRIDSPIGVLELVIQDNFLVGIHFVDSAHNSKLKSRYSSKAAEMKKATTLMKRCRKELDQYFTGKTQHLDLPYRLQGTDFQKKVWTLLTKIPYGETVSYGQLAEKLGSKKWSRAVGGANNKNPIPLVIPCHRVIGAQGNLVGYAPGVAYKRWLLDLESSSKC